MSLKRPFVPKSDVKQRFTTTTLEGNNTFHMMGIMGTFTPGVRIIHTLKRTLLRIFSPNAGPETHRPCVY